MYELSGAIYGVPCVNNLFAQWKRDAAAFGLELTEGKPTQPFKVWGNAIQAAITPVQVSQQRFYDICYRFAKSEIKFHLSNGDGGKVYFRRYGTYCVVNLIATPI